MRCGYLRVSPRSLRTFLVWVLPFGAVVALVTLINVVGRDKVQRNCFATGGALGSLGAAGVLLGHWRGSPKMRRHPQPLIAYRSLADLYVSLHFLIYAAVYFDDAAPWDHDRKDCRAAQALALEVFIISGELWSFCSVHDMQESIQNPFARSAVLMRRYHAIVWPGAAALALAAKKLDIYGWFKVGGGSSDSQFTYCYINSRVVWAPWAFLYGPILTLYVFALALTLSNLYTAYSRYARSFKVGEQRVKLPTTFATHLRVLAINNVNLVAVTVFWLVCGLCFALSYLQLGWNDADRGRLWKSYAWEDTKQAAAYICSYAAALLLPMKGAVDFMVWLLPHEPADVAAALGLPVVVVEDRRADSTTERPSLFSPGAVDEPELKFALQREIFAYVKVGIVAGARRGAAALLDGDGDGPARSAERFRLTAANAAPDATPPLPPLAFSTFARLALSPTSEDQRELRRTCCADFCEADERKPNCLVATVADDAHAGDEDARPSVVCTKRWRSRGGSERGA